jgi:di/tricarboxylate transporter
MFDFTPVGGAVAIAGILFVALVGWRLIPASRSAKKSPHELFEIEDYVSEARVPEESGAIGKLLRDLDAVAAEHDATILDLIRHERRIFSPGRTEPVQADDVVIVKAGPEALDAVLADLELRPPEASDSEHPHSAADDLAQTEAVVLPRSRVAGRTVESLHMRRRYGVNLLAVSRQGHPFRGRLRTFKLRGGDVLLLEGDAEQLPEIVSALGLLPLAPRGLQVGRERQAGLSILIFATAIAAATFGLVSLTIALALAAAALIVLTIVPVREIYDGIDWPVIVLLGAMIPIGSALDATGSTELIAGLLLDLSAGLSPVILLTLVLIITMTLSDVMNNAATAVVMAPLAVSIAERLGVNPDTFMMAVAIGASAAFLTPIGHQNNTLILGPGGYRFGDYWRMGLPLEILIVVVAVPMLLWVWPL